MNQDNSYYNSCFIIIIILFFVFMFIFNYDEYFTTFPTGLIIKKQIPQVNFNPKAEIAFVYVYTPNIFPYAKHSILNILSYAEKYGYGVIIYNQVFNDVVSPCWNKIAAILENIHNYKYLVWIDADAIIVNFDKKIESFINENQSVDLYLCQDIILHKECINSGVMIIKNTQWSYNLFLKVWNSYVPHLHNDQNVIFYEIIKELYPNSTPDLKYTNYCTKIYHPKVQISLENAFNTHILNYNKGDYIIHLMGASTDARINIMRQINTVLKLDNYDKTDCINIINNTNNADRIQYIEDICLKIKRPFFS